MKRNMLIASAIGLTALIALTAGAGAYMITKEDKPAAAAQSSQSRGDKISWDNDRAQPAPQPQQQVVACNDGNIVGTALGGVAGGVVGSQFGKGNGKTATTIGGAVGGAVLGKEFIPTDGVTCR